MNHHLLLSQFHLLRPIGAFDNIYLYSINVIQIGVVAVMVLNGIIVEIILMELVDVVILRE